MKRQAIATIDKIIKILEFSILLSEMWHDAVATLGNPWQNLKKLNWVTTWGAI
jgi:hypothetical protein